MIRACILLLAILLTSSCAVVAQTNSYMSKHAATWEYDYYLGKYEEVNNKKKRTRFVIDREWFALEIDDEFIRWQWAYLQTFEYLGECYITEGDKGMACINSDENTFFVFTEWNPETEQWELGLVLTDIHKIPAIKFEKK